MIPRSVPRLVRVSRKTQKPGIAPSSLSLRVFSTTRDQRGSNRMFSPVRRPEDFSTYVLLSSTSRSPLLTLWTASYCNTCKHVSPVLRELISAGVGEDEGGVSYCEIEYDSPDILGSDLGITYVITSMPTLLSFDRGEAQLQTKVTDPKKMSDRELLKEWIRTEARRKGSGGGGGGVGFFGGLFGSTR